MKKRSPKVRKRVLGQISRTTINPFVLSEILRLARRVANPEQVPITTDRLTRYTL